MRKSISVSRFCRLAAGCMFLLLTIQAASAATVRGQLNRHSGTGAAPAAGICVTVYSEKGGRSARVCSNAQGMYYLANIIPGSYQLEIWTSPSPGASPIRYPITVAEPYTDIHPITLP
jgi:hypothetical protein